MNILKENQITLQGGEQRRIQKAVATKVYELDVQTINRRNYFKELYREIKDHFKVDSYKEIKRGDLQMAIQYIEHWSPSGI